MERILAGAHEFAELRLLSALRADAVKVPDAELASRLLGNEGAHPPARLGLPQGSGSREVGQAAFAALQHWQRHAENPMLTGRSADACRVLVRTCEGLLARR